MLLSSLTSSLQSSYADIQVQIDALQEQQRLIQAQLQRVGSVESKMESAAALVAEAIAEIREVCPDELNGYQQVIGSLFGDAPVAQLTPVADGTNTNEDDWEPTEYGVEVVEDEDSLAVDDSSTVEELMEQADKIFSRPIYTEEVVDESHVEIVASPQVPSGTIHRQPAKPLRWLATKRGIDTADMKRHQIASALVGQVTQDELDEAISQAV